ncbi:MAG TPA: sugar transferase [Bryobacteraceae bacterium]|jgi:sugar transferase (PEP-CTERM system associated)|nr:sugar transferase [Bryobacteraceae bacterium]
MIRVFRVFVPTSTLVLLVSEAVLIFTCYIAAAYAVFVDIDPQIFLLYDGGLVRIAIAAAIIMLGLYFHDLYARFRILSRILLVQQLCLVLGVAFIAQAVLSYLNRNWILPKWLMIYGSALVLITLTAWRIVFSAAVRKAVGAQRILFLGTSPAVFEIVEHLEGNPELGLCALGYLDEDCDPSPSQPAPARRLGCLGDLRQIASQTQPDRIVVGLRERRMRMPINDLLELRFSGVQTEEIANLYETTFGRVCAREIRPSHLVFSSDLGPRRHSVQIQTLYSTAIAFVAFLLTLPVMLVVAIIVKLTSPGPILHRQVRVGLHDRPFTVLKFRSMYQDAEARTGAVWAKKNDPRITPVGRWLRRLRLDELPQLINVLRGDMSIVGPRPERPEFVKTLSEQIPYYRQRHCVKPGITGWAQINYKYGDTIEDTITKLEYDLYYIKNLSFSLDLYIMFHTVKIMLLLRGSQ